MCIALISTAHPEYQLILINNRDEYLNRPTASATWWAKPNGHVLGGRDLLRKVQGTWLGVTKQGRVAVLTNYQEQEGLVVQGAISRGAMVNAFLTQPPSSLEDTETFVQRLTDHESLKGVGGFSLVCGTIGQPLAVVSNRTRNAKGATWIDGFRGVTVGLSNAVYGDRSWPKVVKGEDLMRSAISTSVKRNDTEQDFIKELFKLLSTDTLPRRDGRGFDSYIKELKHSILVPRIAGDHAENPCADNLAAARSTERVEVEPLADNLSDSPVYGTQTQTVLLVDHQGRATFVERLLYDENAQPVPISRRDRVFHFQIERQDPQCL